LLFATWSGGEDWTFREAEVRLGEHRELRLSLASPCKSAGRRSRATEAASASTNSTNRSCWPLVSVPDFTTLYRFLQRLDDQAIDCAVGETVRKLRGTSRKGRRRTRVAVDATGLAQGAVSTFFVRRMHHHGQKPLPWRHWLKWVVAVDLDQQFVLSQLARRGPWNDCANLPALVGAASQQTLIGLVLAGNVAGDAFRAAADGFGAGGDRGGDKGSGAMRGDHARHGFERVLGGFHDVMAPRAVNVHIEEAGDGDFVRGDDFARARGQGHRAARPDGFDYAVAKENRGIGNFRGRSEGTGNLKKSCEHGELLS